MAQKKNTRCVATDGTERNQPTQVWQVRLNGQDTPTPQTRPRTPALSDDWQGKGRYRSECRERARAEARLEERHGAIFLGWSAKFCQKEPGVTSSFLLSPCEASQFYHPKPDAKQQ